MGVKFQVHLLVILGQPCCTMSTLSKAQMLQQGRASQDCPKKANLKEEEEQSLLLVHGIVDNEDPSVTQKRAPPWNDCPHLCMILQYTAGMVTRRPPHELYAWQTLALGHVCACGAGVPDKMRVLLQDAAEGPPGCCR